jgi:hypothetical protein
MSAASEMRAVIADSSIGAAMAEVRSLPRWCAVRDDAHFVSGDALAAGVSTTRCLSCRRRVHLDSESGFWLAEVSA